jgi:alpha-beta hydrolase superfamily lysophospholipase
MLLIHGIGEHSGRYDHVGKLLASNGIDVVAIDLRGHGQSGGRRAYINQFEEFLDDVEDQLAQVRSLGLPTILLGHSLGGLICSSYAVSDRPQPDFLILSGPALAAEIDAPIRAIAPVVSKVAPRLFLASTIDPTILSTDPTVGEAYMADDLVVKGATARLGGELLAEGPRVTARLEHIRVPTLVQHGTNDQLVPVWASEPFEGLEETTRITYPGLEHEIYNEIDKDTVLTDMLDWIHGQSPA